jgi:hypothetical protein
LLGHSFFTTYFGSVAREEQARAIREQREWEAVDRLLRNPISGVVACCARAASGQAAAPLKSAMNFRRFILLARGRATLMMQG